MRRVLAVFSLVFLFLTGIFGWKYLTTPISSCDSPIAYKLGQLDPRFNLTADQAEKDIVQATEIWNKAAGKKVFQEDPQAKLTVNFVYDERQALSSKIGSLENNLDANKKTLDAQITNFLQQKAAFETKLAALNKEISDWNQKGGAPPDIYKQLQDKIQNLKSESEKLQNLAASLNQKTDSYNFQVNQLNGTVSDFNAAISQKPEEGLFDGPNNTIYIYLNSSQQALIHTLTHEFGHALGISHINDSQAIMYPYTSANLLLTLSDKNELSKICQPVSRWQMLKSFRVPVNALLPDNFGNLRGGFWRGFHSFYRRIGNSSLLSF